MESERHDNHGPSLNSSFAATSSVPMEDDNSDHAALQVQIQHHHTYQHPHQHPHPHPHPHPQPHPQPHLLPHQPQQFVHYCAPAALPPPPVYALAPSPVHHHHYHHHFGSAPPHVAHTYPSAPDASYVVAPQWNNAIAPAPIMPASASLRWPILPQSPSVPAKRNAQKEVMRRTKTGCLTCRKRRIKCDEGYPTCNNCRKSKRPCQGYVGFKNAASGPQPIQPAPSLTSLPPGGPPSSSYPYSHNPHPVAENTSMSAITSPLAASTPLDPNLMLSPYPSIAPQREVRPVSMQDLFNLNDVPPKYEYRDPPLTPSPSAQQDIADFYFYHYGPGLDSLLETSWYTDQGLRQLQQDITLNDFVSQCVDAFKARTDDAQAAQRIESLEARLVWQLACLPRLAASGQDDSTPSMQDLLTRLDTLEHLLTGQLLQPQRIPSASLAAPGTPNHNEQTFWHHLGRSVAARDDAPDPAGLREADVALQSMRGILDVIESRDVLYSIAIGRHIGGRMPIFHPQQPILASTPDPNDDVSRLKVAHSFIEAEDQRGSTQVIQRICGMALRGWSLQKSPS